MILSPSVALFDTRIDTRKIFVTIKTKFTLRNYVNNQGKSPLYLFISSPGSRIRLKLDLEFHPEDWDKKKQRLKLTSESNKTNNLILDTIISKITKIKTIYLLSERTLTAKKLEEELKNTTNRVDFLIFFKNQYENEKKMMSNGYYKRVGTVLNKLKRYKSELLFSDIDATFEKKLRIYYSNLGNRKTTINSNLATIKKYLIAAKKQGIKFPLNPEDIQIGKTTGNRTDLNAKELERFYNYYFSEFIPEHWKIVLGYFLFSAFTGLRWSDLIDMERPYILANQFVNFDVKKTGKRQTIAINKKALEIVKHCPNLFVEKITDIYANREIKKIATQLSASKKLTFHVARHTFATNFLRMGGNVVKLQMILGHSNIRETMIYVHIVEQEANEEMSLMDSLF